MELLNKLIKEDDRKYYLSLRMDQYERRQKPFAHAVRVREFLFYVLHYIHELADNDEDLFYDNFLMLAATHYCNENECSVMTITADDAKAYDWDEIFVNGPAVVAALEAEDVDDVMCFLEWDIRNDKDITDPERYINLLRETRESTGPKDATTNRSIKDEKFDNEKAAGEADYKSFNIYDATALKDLACDLERRNS